MNDTLTRKKKAAGVVADPRPPVEPVPDHPLARCKPRGDRLVVRRLAAKTRTEGGLLLAETAARDKRPIGKVWSVGPGKRNDKGELIPIDLKVGDTVIVTGYSGWEVDDNPVAGGGDKEFVIVREEDVIAVLPDD